MPEVPPVDQPRRHLPRPDTETETVLVLAGGGGAHPALVLPAVDLVVAADSGAERAAALDVSVDVVVGDLDSIGPATLAALRAAGARVEHHHPDKDATDLELALAVAVGTGASRIVVVGGHGGRLDHTMATFSALGAIVAPGRRVEAWMGPAQVLFTGDTTDVDGRIGEQVSLVPRDGAVHGITTTGLRWELGGATLPAGSTRGISNEVAGVPVRVAITRGTLAVVRPHALDPAADERPPVPDRPRPEDPR
ncbi:thiamine diphosphokinase [Iamia sp.]|uniref:thiamine diphosphokinase n=1 Tax=Iamia sp. TaxID=2722710 RepID=UPI002BA612A0|nr:thiamine diphosphokinase [Iamia sp.]HXH59530.1 thiamine diphosphokinase [Iamia sp.]